ncbi:YdeI/OmpD-associated family protein [Verrucomicrobiota bacterium sgz303538]
MNPKVDQFFTSAKKWREEMERLRRIALNAGLAEELKWGKPCYTYNDGNVAIIQGFKEQCALMFFKGALLKDPDGLLEAPGEHSNVARRMVFSSVGGVAEMEARLRAFIAQAIEIEKAGLKVEVQKKPEPLPEELEVMFEEVSGLKKAFGALTPGRQRAYVLHFSGAKQSTTRRSRIEKCVPGILDGKGLND